MKNRNIFTKDIEKELKVDLEDKIQWFFKVKKELENG